jgi:hypothetical protein
MVPYEAFRAAKPVVTTSDSGGPLEVVEDGRNGRVVEPDPASVAEALRELLADEAHVHSGRRSSGSRHGDLGQRDREAARMRLRDRIRFLLLLRRGCRFHLRCSVSFAVLYPLMQWTWVGWIIYGVAIAATIGLRSGCGRDTGCRSSTAPRWGHHLASAAPVARRRVSVLLGSTRAAS